MDSEQLHHEQQPNQSDWDNLGNEVPFAGAQAEQPKQGEQHDQSKQPEEQPQQNNQLPTAEELLNKHAETVKGDYISNKAEIDQDYKIRQQAEDASVLLSFCDFASTEKIIHSDAYGALLDNGISIYDLFTSDCLFDEAYLGNGFSADFYYGWRNEVGYAMPYEKAYAWDFDDLDRDVIRSQEAAKSISILADTYFGENSDEQRKSKITDIILVRANGEELDDTQKEFLQNEQNSVADRLLYGAKITNSERAAKIENSINLAVNNYLEFTSELPEKSHEGVQKEFISELIYAQDSIGDYIAADKEYLVKDAVLSLKAAVNNHFDVIASSPKLSESFYADANNEISNLLLNYSDVYELPERAKRLNLVERGLLDVDDIVDKLPGYKCVRQIQPLRELGASDDAILGRFEQFTASSFYGVSNAIELLRAGVDREKIISKTYCSDVFEHSNRASEEYNDPLGTIYGRNKSQIDILTDAGLTATEAAETFNPRDIAKRLPELIEKGADAKDLMEYMMSYRERFVRVYDGDTYTKVHYSGEQEIAVYDKNHSQPRTIYKEMMAGDGIDYVATNLDFFADSGVTEEDIINSVADRGCLHPGSDFMGKLLECKGFDTTNALRLAKERYAEYLKDREQNGSADPEHTKIALDRYYAEAIENATDVGKKAMRNENYRYFTGAETA